MFNNVGGKIKIVAKVFFWFVCIASVAVGLALLGIGSLWWIGLIVLLGGFLSSWVISLFLCGFGQLIESVEKLADNSNSSAMQKENNKTLLQWKEQGLITEEEYNQRIGR